MKYADMFMVQMILQAQDRSSSDKFSDITGIGYRANDYGGSLGIIKAIRHARELDPYLKLMPAVHMFRHNPAHANSRLIDSSRLKSEIVKIHIRTDGY